MTIWLRSTEDGEIVTWGESELPDAIKVVSAPADFATWSVRKYVFIGGDLTVRSGWVEPDPSAEVFSPALKPVEFFSDPE